MQYRVMYKVYASQDEFSATREEDTPEAAMAWANNYFNNTLSELTADDYSVEVQDEDANTVLRVPPE